MKTSKRLEEFKKGIEKSLQEHYSVALSEAIKRGIRAKKAKGCVVKKSKV